MDRIVPGGVAIDPDDAALARLRGQCDGIEAECAPCARSTTSTRGCRTASRRPASSLPNSPRGRPDRSAGRASGQARDLRVDLPAAYDGWRSARRRDARDVAARVAVRFDEIFESLRLLREIAAQLPAGERAANCARRRRRLRVGWVEAGAATCSSRWSRTGRAVRRCHCHDPSWQNWPLLEHAVIGNIVPDFPLINSRSTSATRAGPLMLLLVRQILRSGLRPSRTEPNDAGASTANGCRARSCGCWTRADDRQVDAGSCNGCELEIHALNNPYYNLEGRGIRFVASPRHATCCWSPGRWRRT